MTLNCLAALTILLLLILNLRSLPPQLPLYFSLPWGERQLGSLPEFAILPALIVLISLVNLLISWHLHSSQLVLRRILFAASLVLSFSILLTALKIIYTFI